MSFDNIKDVLTTLYKEFGTTKFSVAVASTIFGACAGFTTVAVIMPNSPIIDNIVKEN